MKIPGYRIERKIAEGGMATVYLAIQESVERSVALKILSRECSDPSFGERFVREARIASKLVHPNIVTIFDAGITDEYHFIAMEYIPGKDLSELGCSLDLKQKIAVVSEVAGALDYAGRNGFVHRDIKPSNILVHQIDRRAVVTDFGIARAEESHTRMTMLGETVGTPYYMSPEQAQALDVDGRSDLYSLGVVFYTLITGRVPFDARSSVEVGKKHVTDPVPRLPAELAVFQDFIDRAMAKIPGQRFQSGHEFRLALNGIHWQAGDQETTEYDDDATRLMPAARIQQLIDSSRDLNKPRSEKLTFGRRISGWLDSVLTACRNRFLSVRARPERALVAGIVAGVILLLLLVVVFSGQKKAGSQLETPVAITTERYASAGLSQSVVDEGQRDQTGQPAKFDADEGFLPPQSDSDFQQTAIASDPVSSEPPVMAPVSAARPAPAIEPVTPADRRQAADRMTATGVSTGEQQHIAELLASGNRYLQENALTVPEGKNAYEQYSRVLELDPFNRAALLGVERIVDKYKALANARAQEQDYSAATILIERAIGLDPGNKSLLRRLERFNAERMSLLEIWLNLGDKLFDDGRLILPPENNALYYYQRVLTQAPDNAIARRRVEEIVKNIVPQVDLAISEGQLEEARSLLDEAMMLSPNDYRLVQLNKRYWDLHDAKNSSAGLLILESGLSKSWVDKLLSSGDAGTRKSLSMYFRYEMRDGASPQANAVLLSADRATVLGKDELSFSRASGRKVVKFERASGFADGWYELDLMQGKRFIHTLRFQVSE